MEVDITEKVKKVLKFGPVALIVLAVLCAGAVWAYQHQQTGLTVYDAKTASTMVSVKAKADGKKNPPGTSLRGTHFSQGKALDQA